MQKYLQSVSNPATGRPIAGASVLVTAYPSGAIATIFSDNGLTQTDNPITASATGTFSFYAANGDYSLTVSAIGSVPLSLPDIQLFDPDDSNDTSLGQDHYPYVLSWSAIPPTATLTSTLPELVVKFFGKKITIPVTSYTASPSSIVDVWVTPAGAYVYEVAGLTAYGSLPRHDDYLHMYRIQTSATKVQGFYERFATVPVYKRSAPRAYNVPQFKNSTVIPGTYVAWVNTSAVTYGTVYRTSLGDLWRCESAGVCAGEPAAPTYAEDLNSGFDIVASGTATFTFRGRSGYKNVWRVSPRAGIQWYFANIAAGLMADRLPAEVKEYLKAVVFHMVDNWIASSNYQEGHKVAGAATQGRVWEATTTGVAGASNPFPASAAIGATCTDGGVTWRCLGVYSNTTQKLFWYDMDPTMKVARSPDSHDSYAATFVWAVWRYIKANPADTAWLSTATTHPSGITYLAMIKEIIYSNMSTQINGTGLTNTFQGNFVPSGGTYSASFLMDNCEVYAGYLAAERLYTTMADAGYAATMASYKNNLLTALEALWEPATGTYKYVHGLASMEPAASGQALFYPLCMSQAWASLWGVPLNETNVEKCFTFMAKHYPSWWARNDVDDLLAIGAHYGYAAMSGSQDIRAAVIGRVETERLRTDQPDLYVMDAAYYLSLRDSTPARNLTALTNVW